MTQLEFYKSFQFMAELMLAEGMFLSSLHGRKLAWLRAVGAVALCFLFAWLFPAASDSPAYLSFMFFMLFLITICMTKFIFKETWLKLAFCCVAGYTLQHLTYQLNYITLVAMLGGDPTVTSGGMYGNNFMPIYSVPFLTVWYYFIIFLTYSVIYWIFGTRFRRQVFQLPSVMGFFMVCALLVLDIVLNTFVVTYMSNMVGIIISGIYSIVCCILGLCLQFEVLLRWGYFSQLRIMKIVSRQKKERYAAVKDAMETVNIKCHDLKHQIRRFYNMNLLSESAARDMEKAIADYAAFTFTGNDALDMILTEINRTCSRNQIRAIYMADGALLSFMSDEDIYIMFSNLLSNAVEAVLRAPAENRTMGLRVENGGTGFVSVIIYNYVVNRSLEIADGLPKTTKKREDLHGFGLKSVRRICEKYNGTMDIFVEDDMFNVSLLFPPQTQKQ